MPRPLPRALIRASRAVSARDGTALALWRSPSDGHHARRSPERLRKIACNEGNIDSIFPHKMGDPPRRLLALPTSTKKFCSKHVVFEPPLSLVMQKFDGNAFNLTREYHDATEMPF